MQPLSNGSNPDYINTKMEDHSWFVGDMDRESANTMLDEFPLGTFLVRCRVHQVRYRLCSTAVLVCTINSPQFCRQMEKSSVTPSR